MSLAVLRFTAAVGLLHGRYLHIYIYIYIYIYIFIYMVALAFFTDSFNDDGSAMDEAVAVVTSFSQIASVTLFWRNKVEH